MSRAELFATASRSSDPADKVANGRCFRRLAAAVLEQALKDAKNGVDIPRLKTWVNRGDVEALCALSEMDVDYYRRQLNEIIAKREARTA